MLYDCPPPPKHSFLLSYVSSGDQRPVRVHDHDAPHRGEISGAALVELRRHGVRALFLGRGGQPGRLLAHRLRHRHGQALDGAQEDARTERREGELN